MSVPNVERFIDLLISIPADGHSNSFAYVMSEWTKQQGTYIALFVANDVLPCLWLQLAFSLVY